MATKTQRRRAYTQFVEATFYAAFARDIPANWKTLPARELRYLTGIARAGDKLNTNQLLLLANIADGTDFDGSSLREDVNDGE